MQTSQRNPQADHEQTVVFSRVKHRRLRQSRHMEFVEAFRVVCQQKLVDSDRVGSFIRHAGTRKLTG